MLLDAKVISYPSVKHMLYKQSIALKTEVAEAVALLNFIVRCQTLFGSAQVQVLTLHDKHIVSLCET